MSDYFTFIEQHKYDPYVLMQTMLEAINALMYEQIVKGKLSYDEETDFRRKWRELHGIFGKHMRDIGFTGMFPFESDIEFTFEILQASLPESSSSQELA